MSAGPNNLLVIDAHLDLAYNALAFGRDYRRSALETRALEQQSETPAVNGQCTVGLPELLAGNVAIVFGTLFTMPAHRALSRMDIVYRDAQEAHRQGMAQLDVYHRWADEGSGMTLIQRQSDLESVLATWSTPSGGSEPAERQVGMVLSMENAEPIRQPAELEVWVERGVRIVGPAWTGNRYTGGTGQPGPLTDLGRELVEMMADLRIGLDVSHMAERAALEALDRFEGVVLASHSNPQAIVPGDRQLSDALIRGIAERDGVVGVALYNRFLSRDWRKGDRKELVTLTDVVRAVDYVCQRVGDAAHVGLGSDLDGGLGSESAPAEIDTVADLPKIAMALAGHGFEQKDVDAVMGGNWMRLLHRLLPA